MKNKFIVICILLFCIRCSYYKNERKVESKNSEKYIQDDLVLDTAFKKIHLLNHVRNKILVVKYWANWCTPCIASMPEFIKEGQEISRKKKNFSFATLSVDHYAHEWKESIQNRKWQIDHFWIGDDKKNELFQQIYHTTEIDGEKLDSIQVLPTYLILNSKGEILLNSIPEEDSYQSFKKYIDKN